MNNDNNYLLPGLTAKRDKSKWIKSNLLITAVLLSSLLVACGDDDNKSAELNTQNPSFDLAIPDSLTGGQATVLSKAESANEKVTTVSRAIQLAKDGTGEPCSYLGNEDEENPFRNGYETTKFLVSIMASWTCIADLFIDVAGFVPHNGEIYETENDNNTADFEADEPTHYSVMDDSDTQVTVRLYYNYSRSQPPVSGEKSQFYTSWNTAENGDVEGRMVVDSAAIDWDNHDSEDPAMMRMDFNFTDSQKTADMFMQFDNNNEWADGFRIKLVRNLDSNPLLKVFEAHGLINMKAQFVPSDVIPELPDVHLYAVTDALGNGASIAEFRNTYFPLEINAELGNYLGDYIYDKKDVYFFEHDMDWEYIDKTVLYSEYRGNRTTPETGGSWIPFDVSLDMIITGLSLDSDYFTGSKCAVVGDDCNDLLNAVFNFTGGFADQEENQGTDPLDWRSIELDNAEYLTTVYPNGIDWSGAFEHSFTPTENP